jgi:antitoxin component YwqK of YwqJK toxin-antitoxin module
MIKKMIAVQVAVAALAFAEGPAVVKAPLIKSNHQLACAAGTKQVGGFNSNMGAIACMKSSADGLRVFHGPMVALYKSNKVEAMGQIEEGMRSGKWTFFNESGVRVGETEFSGGDYSGRRIGYNDNGTLKFDEVWVNGKRQGAQKSFDAAGNVTVTEFKDDRPVTK